MFSKAIEIGTQIENTYLDALRDIGQEIREKDGNLAAVDRIIHEAMTKALELSAQRLRSMSEDD